MSSRSNNRTSFYSSALLSCLLLNAVASFALADTKLIDAQPNTSEQEASSTMGASAYFLKGNMLYYATPPNYGEAFDWFLKAADKMHVDAQLRVAWMYAEGEGVRKDLSESAAWYQAAADQGSPTGQYNLGWMYDKGLGVDKDFTQAAVWYLKAAEQGDATAQNNMGLMHE